MDISLILGYYSLMENHHREMKVGYQCENCHKIIIGVPKREVSKGNTYLTLICGNNECNARLYESGLNYLYYNRRYDDMDD